MLWPTYQITVICRASGLKSGPTFSPVYTHFPYTLNTPNRASINMPNIVVFNPK